MIRMLPPVKHPTEKKKWILGFLASADFFNDQRRALLSFPHAVCEITVTEIFFHPPPNPAEIDGFYLCVCIRSMYAVELAFDLHLLTLNELLLHAEHCVVLKYEIGETFRAQVEAVGCNKAPIDSSRCSCPQ